jgi:hypothetical protein
MRRVYWDNRMRGLASVFLLVFLAGPAIHLDCLVSCWARPVAEVADESCHLAAGTNDGTSLIGAAGDCGDVVAFASPFVKTSGHEALALGLAAGPSHPDRNVSLHSFALRPPSVVRAPGVPLHIPLRI